MVTVSLSPKSQAEFMAAIRQFASDSKQTLVDACLEQGALACQDAATFTPPLPKGGGRGLSVAAKKAGENAVAGDIKKLFVASNDRDSSSASALLTNQLAYATKANDLSLFNKIMNKGSLQSLRGISPIMRKISLDQDRTRAFQKAKNYFNTTNPIITDYGQGFVQELRSPHNRIKAKFGGRIGKNVRPVRLKMLVDSKSELTQYIKDRQQMVGMIKAGWASALSSLPKPIINGVPKNFGTQLLGVVWINRHNQVQGKHDLVATDKSVKLTIINTEGNINGIAVDADILGLVYANRIKQMKGRFEKLMNNAVQRFNK